jgi:hypothetical protein
MIEAATITIKEMMIKKMITRLIPKGAFFIEPDWRNNACL